MNKTLKKLLGAVISITMLISALPNIAFADSASLDDDLLFHLTFDETDADKTSFAASKGGTVTKHGTVSIDTSLDEESGNALKIDANAAGNYLELPKGILNGKEAATFSFWIKPNSGWAFMTTPVSGAQEYLHEKYLGMLATSSTFTAERYNNSGTRLSSVITNGTYMDWQYVTAVFSENGTKVYVNGELAGSDTAKVDVKALMTADASTWIGHGNWNSGEGFSGMIDDFRVYGKALNEGEIAELSAKAVQREKDKMLAEKNCLEIDTQFYSNFSMTESGKDVTVSLPAVSEDKYSVIAASYTNGVLSNVQLKTQADVTDKAVTFADLKQNNDDKVKMFVWNSINGIEPIKDNKVFQIKENEKVTVKTNITNYTPTDKSIKCDIVPYNADGNRYEHPDAAGAPFPTAQEADLAVMESKNFTFTVNGNNQVSYYKVIVTDTSDSKTYDAGFLPVADVSFPDATPADSADTTEGVHDPTIFKDPVSKKYYAYSSHNLVFESEDLINWTKHDYTKQVTVPNEAKAYIENNIPKGSWGGKATANGTYWAPDLYYKEGDEYPYWFYLSTSCFFDENNNGIQDTSISHPSDIEQGGGENSVISLVKAKSPGLWDGETQEGGIVIASKDGHNTNSIDANIFTDTDGKTYFIWGSFWKGIHMAELDTETGRVKGVDYTSDATILSSCQKFGTRMYSTPSGVAGPEGPYTIYNKDTGYRYMFTSYGWLGTNYNIRVARTDKTFAAILSGKDPHKQLLDHKNRPVGATFNDQVKEGGTLQELWGYKMSGSFQLGDGIEYLGSGHNSVFQDDDGQWYLVQHCRKVADAIAYLQVKKILWTEDGWPVISPMVYAGEKEQDIPENMLYGTWDLSSVGHTILREGVVDVSVTADKPNSAYKGSDLPVHSSQIILQPDGTLGNHLGTWEFDGKHTVTVNFAADGDNENYEFYQDGDTMKLYVLTGYDKDKRESALVMTGTDQNSIASFAKKSSAVAQSTKNIHHIEATPTVIEKSTKGNPILGFDENGNTMYAGDPAALVDGDTVYIYAGHDTSTADNYVMPEWVCYSSKDMTDWKYEGSVMKATDVSWRNDNNSAWASQAIKYGDKYYLYFCTWDKNDTFVNPDTNRTEHRQSIGVAVSDSPTGPFKDIGAPLISGKTTEPQTSGWNDIDPTVWVETVDGVEHRYLAWGNGIFYVCELNEDMVSVKDMNDDGQIKMNDDIKQQTFNNLPEGLGFTEAPWIYRRKDTDGNYTGKYYMFGAFGWREQMGYVTSDSMYGPWEWGGILMPPTATSNTNHPSVIDFNNKTYFIYHNGSLPWGSGFRRSVCLAQMYWENDGTIRPIDELSTGLNYSEAVKIELSTDTTSDVHYLAHEEFVNPSDDASYPLKKQLAMKHYELHSGGNIYGSLEEMWQIKPAKYNSENENYVSIESYDKAGLYITADGTNLVLTQQATLDRALARKMTFKTVEAINGQENAVSFESVAKSGYFITLTADGVTLTDGTDADACSFTVN